MKYVLKVLVFTFIIWLGAGMTGFSAPAIVDFEIEIELKNNLKYDIEYEVKQGDKIEAKYAIPGEVTQYGKNAVKAVEALLQELNVTPESDQKQLVSDVLRILRIKESDVDDFELEVKFEDGKKIDIDL